MKRTLTILLICALVFAQGCATTMLYYSRGGPFEMPYTGNHKYLGTYSIEAIERVYRDGETLVVQARGTIPGRSGSRQYEVRVPLDVMQKEYQKTGRRYSDSSLVETVGHKARTYDRHVWTNDKEIALSTATISKGEHSALPKGATEISVFEVPSARFSNGISNHAPLLNELRAGEQQEGKPAVYFGTPVAKTSNYRNNTFVYVDDAYLWEGENFISFTLPAVSNKTADLGFLLWPLAIVWDIATSPIQLAVVLVVAIAEAF